MLAIGVPALLLSLATIALDYHALKSEAYEQTERYELELATRYAAQLDADFDAAAQVARSSADFLNTHPDLAREELYALLTANVRQRSLIYGSCIAFEPYTFEPDTRLFAPYVYRGPRPDPKAIGPDRLDGDEAPQPLRTMDVAVDAYDYTDPKWDWFRIPRESGQAFWTEPFFDDGAGNVVMCTFVAPFFRDGKFRGTCNIDVQLDQLQQQIIGLPAKDYHCSILSRTGVVISDKDPSRIMSASLEKIARLFGREDVVELGRRMMRGERGVARTLGLADPVPMILAFAPIHSTGWCFLVGVPEDAILAEVFSKLQLRTALMLGAVLLILVIVLLSGLWITRPIGRLADAVRQLAGGDLAMQSVDIASLDEIGDLARAFNRMVKDLAAHVQALTQATADRERVESELRVARNIQNSLLPQRFPPYPERPEFDLHAINAPARHVAGDFFDFFFVDDESLMLVIADVSGKGVPAAMYMAVTRTVLRHLAQGSRSPGEILTRANAVMLAENVQSMFVTLVLARYEPRTGLLRYANAGHPLPYLLDPSRGVQRFGRVTGPILGIIEHDGYEEEQIELPVGAKLILYTDGVPEARAPGGEFYQEHRLRDLLTRSSALPIEALCVRIVHEVRVFQDDELSDDVTILALQQNA